MGKGFVIKDEQIKKKVHKEIEKWTQRVIHEGNSINQNIRETSIVNWYMSFDAFHNHNYQTMLDATKCGYYTHWHGDTVRYVIFYSGIDKDSYSYPYSLTRQLDLYQEIDDPREYVIDLQLNKGILGLPEYFSYRTINGIRQEVDPYKNQYFGGYNTPLYQYSKNAYSRWFKRKFYSKMSKWH